jgi:hypothetical protein
MDIPQCREQWSGLLYNFYMGTGHPGVLKTSKKALCLPVNSKQPLLYSDTAEFKKHKQYINRRKTIPQPVLQ